MKNFEVSLIDGSLTLISKSYFDDFLITNTKRKVLVHYDQDRYNYLRSRYISYSPIMEYNLDEIEKINSLDIVLAMLANHYWIPCDKVVRYLKHALKYTDKYHISYEYTKFISSHLTMALDLLYTDTKPYIDIVSPNNLKFHDETLKLYKLGKHSVVVRNQLYSYSYNNEYVVYFGNE